MVRSYSWILVLAREGLINNALAGQGFLNAPLTLASTRIATVTSFAHFLFMRLTLTIYADLIQLSPGDDESGGKCVSNLLVCERAPHLTRRYHRCLFDLCAVHQRLHHPVKSGWQ